MATVQINNRIDQRIKEEGYAKLKEIGMSASQLFEGTLQYVINNGKPPFRVEVMSNEDTELLKLAKAALESDEPVIEVDLNDLRKTLHIKI